MVFLEKFTNAANQLKKNLQALKTENGKVFNTDSLQFLSQKNSEDPFDIVFIDPPFHQGFVPQILVRLAENNWLAPNALLYVETEKTHPPLDLPENWQIIKEKTAGQVVSRLIRT